eukprot:12332726-Alexandrium_andersonii.AAC.1
MRELQRQLRRVEVPSEAAQARLAERAQQEVTLVQNVLAGAEGATGKRRAGLRSSNKGSRSQRGSSLITKSS